MRLFIGVPLPKDIRATLHKAAQRSSCADRLRLTPEENFHVTVAFLGEIPEEQTASLCQDIDRISAELKAFPASCGEIEAFPNGSDPRVLVAGLSEGRQEAKELIKVFQKGLGLHSRRNIVPHITLGRVKKHHRVSRRQLCGDIRLPEVMDFHVDTVVLYESRLESSGAVYTPLHTARLTH
ncbi:MAG: RNA 2',3'-cyclic phosphodiesterase [Spirochaetota bacterium]